MALKIGALAKLTQTTAPTIRYYEKIGLLPRADRQDGGQRRYSDEDVRRLRFIRRCREFALPIEQVQILMAMMRNGERSCAEARNVAQRHLLAVRARIVELEGLERTIVGLVQGCDASRAGAAGVSCEAWREALRARHPPHPTR